MAGVVGGAGLWSGTSLPAGLGAGRLDFYHWVWPLLFFVTLTLALAASDLVERLALVRRSGVQPALVAVAALVVAVPTLVSPSLDRTSNRDETAGSPIDRRYIDALADGVMAERDRIDGPVAVLSRGQFLFDGFDTALALELEDRGLPVRVSRDLARNVHGDRLADRATVGSGVVLLVDGVVRQPTPDGRLLADVDLTEDFDWAAAEALLDQIRSADEVRLDPETEARMEEAPDLSSLLLAPFRDSEPEDRVKVVHDPLALQALLDEPPLEPRLDPDLIERVRTTLPENPRVFRLRVYLLDRPELLAFATSLELGEP
jgi:hypothetical protein